jgi:hypothetical protein
MVRTPTKTCPNLHTVLTEAPPELLARFLISRRFEKLGWLESYRSPSDASDSRERAVRMLSEEPKATLGPLETEATRIAIIAGSRGQFVLEGLVNDADDETLGTALVNWNYELARSLWAWLDCTKLFEAAENVLHLRLFRRYDKHYQTFAVAPAGGDRQEVGAQALDDFLKELESGIKRGTGCSVDLFNVAADGDDPDAQMYIIRHPKLPTAAREIDEDGMVSSFYFRPPGEATVVYVPSTGRVHVRADTRAIRHLVWKAFVSKALAQEISHQPVDFQAYDLSRFLDDFELPLPHDGEALIKKASLIRLEASIGTLANRISVATTIERGVNDLIKGQPGLDRVFANAVAIRFVEIAVKYRRDGRNDDQVLNFTVSDGNTSSLLSLEDPFEQALGHRLLKEWRIVVEGRAPSPTDLQTLLPAILALWDAAVERVAGAWLLDRNLNVQSLLHLGFLVPDGSEDDDLIEDEEVGIQEAQVDAGPRSVDLVLAEGQTSPGGDPERYRRYRVRAEWVVQYLKEKVVHQFGTKTVETITPNLLFLGCFDVNGDPVPTYLARRLHEERSYAEIDTALRSRSHQGIGLVLNAGSRPGFSLAANVLVTFTDYLAAPFSEDTDHPLVDIESLRSAFVRHLNLAQGGETVKLEKTGENLGTLHVPGKGTITIEGENRLLVIERLVAAYRKSGGPMKTEDMTKGIADQSLSNIFGKDLWEKLKANFLRSRKKGLWEIAA